MLKIITLEKYQAPHQNTAASETSLPRSSLRGRQRPCCTVGLAKSSLKQLLPLVSTDLLTPHLKTLTLQAQLSASDQLSPRGRGASCYTRGVGLEQGVHRTKNSCFPSLATQTGVLKPPQDTQRHSAPAILPVLQNTGKCFSAQTWVSPMKQFSSAS